MISKLTSQQEIDLRNFYQESLKIGQSIEPIDHKKCELIISRFYERINKEKPKFIYCDSPLACSNYIKSNPELTFQSNLWSNLRSNLYLNLWVNLWVNLRSRLDLNLEFNIELNLWSNLRSNLDSNLYSNLWSNLHCTYFAGQQWLSYSHYYKFCEKIGVTYSDSNLELLNEWFEEGRNLHWWFPFENICLISERPIRLSLNDKNQLHNENAKAYEYADGWGSFYLNGICVPEELVKTSAENLSVDFFKREKNGDVKAEFVRKFGVERMLEFGKKIDTFENYSGDEYEWWHKSEYELYDMAAIFPGLETQPYLKMLNQTTNIWHMEAVSPNCKTLKDALKERFGGREMKIVNIT